MTADHHIDSTLVVLVFPQIFSCIVTLGVRTSASTAPSSTSSSAATLPALARRRSDEGKIYLNRLIQQFCVVCSINCRSCLFQCRIFDQSVAL